MIDIRWKALYAAFWFMSYSSNKDVYKRYLVWFDP